MPTQTIDLSTIASVNLNGIEATSMELDGVKIWSGTSLFEFAYKDIFSNENVSLVEAKPQPYTDTTDNNLPWRKYVLFKTELNKPYIVPSFQARIGVPRVANTLYMANDATVPNKINFFSG